MSIVQVLAMEPVGSGEEMGPLVPVIALMLIALVVAAIAAVGGFVGAMLALAAALVAIVAIGTLALAAVTILLHLVLAIVVATRRPRSPNQLWWALLTLPLGLFVALPYLRFRARKMRVAAK